jgi:hypothetical protein
MKKFVYILIGLTLLLSGCRTLEVFSGRHIYVVDLSTLEARLLQAPGLPLDWWWLAPSWQL